MKTILRRRLASLRSVKRLRAWVGLLAATCRWTFEGLAVTSIGCARAGVGRLATRHHRDKRDDSDRCRPAGAADDPDRLWERGRSRRQRYRPAARPPRWEHH